MLLNSYLQTFLFIFMDIQPSINKHKNSTQMFCSLSIRRDIVGQINLDGPPIRYAGFYITMYCKNTKIH